MLANFHTLAGLPRSGSTLLANVLNQHPQITVSGTSALPYCVEAVQAKLSSSPEVQSDLANVPGAYGNYLAALRGLVEGWYAERATPIVIDKGRTWITQRALLDQLAPRSIVIACVRDPRDVVASIERQHRATALFASPIAPTIYDAADTLMKPDGMIGGPIRYLEDLIRRQHTGVLYLRYESFVADPRRWLAEILTAIAADPYTFDTVNVANSATDLDAIHRGKYPHQGTGKIEPHGRSWHDVLDPELAAKIAAVYPLYMQTFAYSDRPS